MSCCWRAKLVDANSDGSSTSGFRERLVAFLVSSRQERLDSVEIDESVEVEVSSIIVVERSRRPMMRFGMNSGDRSIVCDQIRFVSDNSMCRCCIPCHVIRTRLWGYLVHVLRLRLCLTPWW
jgi:hypothetical protein